MQIKHSFHTNRNHDQIIVYLVLDDMNFQIQSKGSHHTFNYNPNYKFDNISELFDLIQKSAMITTKAIDIVIDNKLDFYHTKIIIQVIINYFFKHYMKLYSRKTNYQFNDIILCFVKSNLTSEEIDYINYLSIIYNAQEKACYWSDLASNTDGSQIKYVENMKKDLSKNKLLKLINYDISEINKYKMGLIKAVNQGSEYDPEILIAEYFGASNNDPWIILIGKGIIYDSGGYSLKSSDGMKTMRLDKCGASDVMSIIDAASKLELKLNIAAISPITENVISNKAIKPGEIVVGMNKKKCSSR